MGVFKIKADNFEWIGGAADDPKDLCLHGHVTVQFGDTILEDHGTHSALQNLKFLLCRVSPLASDGPRVITTSQSSFHFNYLTQGLGMTIFCVFET